MAVSDRVAKYILELGGDDADLRQVMSGVKSRFSADVAELKRTGDKLDLFGAITDNVPKVQAALDKAKASVKSFSDQIDQIKGKGGTVTKDLTDGLAQAEAAAKKAGAELAKQQQQLATLGNQLQKVGLDTNNLAASQVRLAEATKAATAAAELYAAKQNLGLVTLKDTETQAAKLRASFDLLKNSGTLSASEIAIAQSKLNTELKALGDTVTKTGGGMKSLGTDIKAAFTSVGGPALAAVGGIAAVTAAVTSAIAAAKEYRTVTAEASAGTDLAKASVSGLARESQNLAQELGLNVNETIKATFALLKSGVPEDNVVDVLRTSAEAAKASLSDVGTGVKIAKLFLNDLKIPASDLGHAFDVLKVTVGGSKEGFESFAASAGPLLAVAKASNIGLADLTATLRAMTKSGLDTEDAISALQKIILALASPDTRAKLQGVGVTATDLVGIFTQLGTSGAKLQDVLDLTGVSKKQAAAVASIINDTKRLTDQFARTQNAGEAVAKTNEKLFDTPQEISERFHATLDVTKEKLGELAGTGGRATVIMTALFGRLNIGLQNLADINERLDAQQVAIDQATLRWLGFGAAERKAADEAANYAAKEVEAGRATEDHTAKIEAQRTTLATQAGLLIKDALALQVSIDTELKAVEDRSKREIAAIELVAGARRRQGVDDLKALEEARVSAGVTRTIEQGKIDIITQAIAARQQEGISAKDAAAQILVAQQDEADKEFKIIGERETKITAEIERGFAARRDAAKGNQIRLREIDAEELAAVIDRTNKTADKYKSLYETLAQQAKAGQDKVNAIDSERISFNEQIALKLRGIRQEGISDAEAYAQKLRDIDELTSKAKRALDEGDFKLGKQYTDQAITTAESLTKVVNEEGTTIVSGFQVQQEKLVRIKGAADQYSAALRGQGEAAQDGVVKVRDQMETVRVLLEVYERRLDNLRLKLSDSIVQKIDVELNGVEQAREIIKELVKPQNKYIHVVTVKPGESAPSDQPEQPIVGLARGGPVWRQYAQQFANGGFARPTWSKVPGSGDGDTVPALLNVGSFVMRKQAVAKYGDGLMSQMVRGYGSGGSVDPLFTGLLFGNIPQGKKNQAQKLADYVNSLPPEKQQQYKQDIELGGTAALIAQNEAQDAIATQERGAPKSLAPEDISPTPPVNEAINYARFIESHLKFGGIMDLVKKQIGADVIALQRNPNNEPLIQDMIKSARVAATNNYLETVYGKTAFGGANYGSANLPDWFDYSAQQQRSKRLPAWMKPRQFANGGDVVPAMLTPGERVFSVDAVKFWGGELLEQMNALQFPAPPKPMHFASGGVVPGASISDRGTASFGGSTFGDIHIHTTEPIDSPRTVDKFLRAVDNRMRRAGQTIPRK